jgi:hypothetical protein
MNDAIRVELPEDLADELVGKGFEEFFVFRGLLSDAGTIVTVTSAGLAFGANFATIIVSRSELGEFVDAVRDWVRRKAGGKPDTEVTIDVSARHGTEETRVRVRVESKNGAPEVDTTALTAFITSLFPPRTAQGPGTTSD